MSSELAIHAQQLGKTFQLYERPLDRLRQMVARNDRRYYREFVALNNVSFELGKGEVLGLVGRNGAGKSTLLQLICGTLNASSGSVSVQGRVAALLELGAGFNPQFTGRENIYLNASILGLSKAEIDERYDAIVDFSGIGDFIHQPVKTYSSGMYVRLAFSIATSVDPNILIIDEALSVGDGAFARKSFDRIMQLKERGATILFCSHSMYHIEALCTRALWLEKGEIQQLGSPATVVAKYQAFLDRDTAQPSAPAPKTVASGSARILAVKTRVDDETGTSLEVRSGQQTVGIEVGFVSDSALPSPVVGVTLNGHDGRILASSSTHADHLELARDDSGRGTATLEFPNIPLLKGEYFIWVYLLSENGIHIYDSASNVATLHFSQQTLEQGLVALPHTWQSIAGADEQSSESGSESYDPLDILATVAEHDLSAEQSAAAAQYPALAQRMGMGCNQSGEWFGKAHPPWRLTWLRSAEPNAWHELFRSTLGFSLSPALCQWKYRDSDKLGIGVWHGDELVASYGGLPRVMSYFGQPATGLQLSDAMVRPSERDAFAVNGPFHQAAISFAELQLGDGQSHRLGYGFSEQQQTLPLQTLGLYAAVDTMTEIRWPALQAKSSFSLFSRAVTNANAAVVDLLWLEMKNALQGSIVEVRDWAYLNGRYLIHPQQPYSVFLVRRRFSGAAVGIVVLRDRQEQGLELIDFIAPPERFKLLLGVARRFAGKLGRTEVFTSITTSHADLLNIEGGRSISLDLIVSANIWTAGPSPDELRDHFWLMAGDAELR